MKLNDHVGSAFENLAHLVQPCGEDIGTVRLLAAQSHVPTNGVPLSALCELAVVREEDRVVLVCVDGLVVVKRIRPARLGRSP